MSRRWVSSRCRNTSESGKFRFRSAVWALKASMPPYATEYRGGLPPARMSGRCVSDSSSHEVRCAMISLIDQAPVTPGSSISESDRPAQDACSAFQASSRRFRSCDLSTFFSRWYGNIGEKGVSSRARISALLPTHNVLRFSGLTGAQDQVHYTFMPPKHIPLNRSHGL